MKQPLSGTIRGPAHVERVALCNSLRDDGGTLVFGIGRDLSAAIDRVDSVVEAVQVERMRLVGCVDPPPAHALTDVVAELFREGPRFSVDGGQPLACPQPSNLRHHLDHEDLVVRSLPRWVHHQGASEFRVNAMTQLEIIAVRGAPIKEKYGVEALK